MVAVHTTASIQPVGLFAPVTMDTDWMMTLKPVLTWMNVESRAPAVNRTAPTTPEVMNATAQQDTD